MNEADFRLLRAAIAVARRARERGDEPYGAVLADAEGNVLLEAGNTQVTERDPTGHAETNLIRLASRRLDPAALATCTLYASAEPCAMCSGAIFWAGVGRVVYGLGADRIYERFPPDAEDPVMRLPCRDVLARGTRRTEVLGPALEKEAERVFDGPA